MPSYQPRIAIIGGGPAGLTLGVLLQKRGISATIYELRSKPTAEELAQPSGTLDLHQESGVAAIRECGLFDQFQALSGDCTEATKVIAKDGSILYTDEGQLESRPEIARYALVGLLLNNLPPELIQWNHKIVGLSSSVSAEGNAEVTLDLGENGRKTYDLVIGADGAWSKTRSLLTEVTPQYSGTQYIMATTTELTKKHKHLAEFVGTGVMFSLADRRGILSHRGAMDSVRLDIAFENEDANFGTTSGWAEKTYAEAKEFISGNSGLFAEWGTPLRELIDTSFDDETARNPQAKVDLRPLYMLPIGHKWDSKPGITLIGDAAHLMTPWAGEGVNLAMWDALDLSRVIANAKESQCETAVSYQQKLTPMVMAFEKRMMYRAQDRAEETWRNKQMLLENDNGSQALADLFKSFQGPMAVISAVSFGLGYLWRAWRRYFRG